MDWMAAVDNYCERLGPGFWAEPVNALTNAAFLLGAVYAWMRAAGDPGARLLAILLGLIGVGSFLFHTLATRLAGLADVVPILLFILTYLYLATRRFFAAPVWQGLLAAALFLPLSIGVAGVVRGTVSSLNGSEGYLGVVVAILVYAAALTRGAPATARGLLVGAALLMLSLTARSADAATCGATPFGTHFLWHLVNGAMLAWMIGVLRAHPRSVARARGAL